MKILFVAGNVYPNEKANSNIINNLKEELVEGGHIVHLLGKSDDNDILDGQEIFYYKNKTLNKLNEFLRKKTSTKEKLLFLLSHPKCLALKLLLTLRKNYVNNKYKKICKKSIKILNNQFSYDCIIAVSMPIYTSQALSKTKIKCVKIEYRLDSYAFNAMETEYSFEQKINIEKEILNGVSHAFVTELDYKLLMTTDIKKYTDKISILQFPNVKKRDVFLTEELEKIKKDKRKTFSFLGYLYPDIRRPEHVLSFFEKLSKDVPLTLYLYGGGCEDVVSMFKERMGDSLQIGHVTSKESFSIMCCSDFLVNIGNAETHINMLPSKILDYVSTGKPILNFIKTEKCPTIDYLQPYNNHINVIDEEWRNYYKSLKQFCLEEKNMVSFEEIEQKYSEFTPKIIVKKIIDVINQIGENL